jgi:hypothetical protein
MWGDKTAMSNPRRPEPATESIKFETNPSSNVNALRSTSLQRQEP